MPFPRSRPSQRWGRRDRGGGRRGFPPPGSWPERLVFRCAELSPVRHGRGMRRGSGETAPPPFGPRLIRAGGGMPGHSRHHRSSRRSRCQGRGRPRRPRARGRRGGRAVCRWSRPARGGPCHRDGTPRTGCGWSRGEAGVITTSSLTGDLGADRIVELVRSTTRRRGRSHRRGCLPRVYLGGRAIAQGRRLHCRLTPRGTRRRRSRSGRSF